MIVLCTQEMSFVSPLNRKLMARKVQRMKLRNPYHRWTQCSSSDDPHVK